MVASAEGRPIPPLPNPSAGTRTRARDDAVAKLVERITFWAALLTSAATFAVIFFVEPLGDRAAQISRIAIPAGISLASFIAHFLARRQQVELGVGLVIAVAMSAITYHVWLVDLGLNSYSLSLFAVLTCAASLLIGPRAGLVTASVALAIILFFYVGDSTSGRIPRELMTSRLGSIGITNNLLVHITLLSSTAFISVYFSRKFRLALLESLYQEQRFREIFSATPQACMIHRNNQALLANEAMRALCGADNEDALVGLSPDAIYTLLRRAAPPGAGPNEDGDSLFRVSGKNGAVRYVLEKSTPVDLADGAATFTMLIDKTDEYLALVSLQEAKEAADAASTAKSMFLANMSHEIRTPLNGIMGLTELSLDPALPHEKRMEYARMVLDSSNALLGILSDVLDLSKIEAGKVHLEPREFDLHELLGNVHHGFASLATGKGLETALTLAPGTPKRIEVDPTRLRQVVSNLIHNAIKFTEEGRIDILASAPAPNTLRISVRDTGIGIAEDTLALLFKPFVQADNSTTRRFGGTGLGLALCKQLTELMGGKVTATSREGAGTTFTIEIPVVVTEADSAIPRRVAAAASITGLRLLLVEDNLVNQTVLKAILVRAGAVVETASGGQEALHLLDSHTPRFDLVLLDLQMPDMDGFEVATRVREKFSPALLPIIALTASVLTADRERTAAVGFNDYLPKPVPTEKLIATILQWCGGETA